MNSAVSDRFLFRKRVNYSSNIPNGNDATVKYYACIYLERTRNEYYLPIGSIFIVCTYYAILQFGYTEMYSLIQCDVPEWSGILY